MNERHFWNSLWNFLKSLWAELVRIFLYVLKREKNGKWCVILWHESLELRWRHQWVIDSLQLSFQLDIRELLRWNGFYQRRLDQPKINHNYDSSDDSLDDSPLFLFPIEFVDFLNHFLELELHRLFRYYFQKNPSSKKELLISDDS